MWKNTVHIQKVTEKNQPAQLGDPFAAFIECSDFHRTAF